MVFWIDDFICAYMMWFLITKTLVKEFLQCPKYARWHVNRKDVYTNIQKDLYGDMDMASLWQDVEDMFLSRYPNFFRVQDPFDARSTLDAIVRGEQVIYQPVFMVDNLYVRADLLIKNDKWLYDIIEVKSKNAIKGKSEWAAIYDDLLYDISFQSYVVSKVMGKKFSGNISLVYMNRDFVKNGPIDPDQLFVQENCRDSILPATVISSLVYTLSHTMMLSQDAFDTMYPYSGENPLLYFGQQMPNDSIFAIKWRYAIKPFLVDRYHAWKRTIHDLSSDDIDLLMDSNGTGKSAATYILRMQDGSPIIDQDAIAQTIDTLPFPLCFYDYETVSTPIPLFEGYRPWQQIVVQYSMHIVYQDGMIEHKQSIIQPWDTTNIRVISDFVRDIWSGYGTYIVWNKSFENGRNSDIGLLYPQYSELFSSINEHTFDLMDIFKNNLYFHPDFGWSASIKKVLPVLTDISYKDLAVSDGGTATDLLQKIITWKLDSSVLDKTIADLCVYCTQDTWAMVEIWKKISH